MYVAEEHDCLTDCSWQKAALRLLSLIVLTYSVSQHSSPAEPTAIAHAVISANTVSVKVRLLTVPPCFSGKEIFLRSLSRG